MMRDWIKCWDVSVHGPGGVISVKKASELSAFCQVVKGVGEEGVHVNSLMCLTLRGVSRFGWQKLKEWRNAVETKHLT